VIRVRNSIVVAGGVAALASSALGAEPPIALECTIGYWNSKWVKEMEHDYQTGYSATKVAPKDIAWLRPHAGVRIPRPGERTQGFFEIGRCQKGNLTSSTDLRKLMIKLSKLASDHGANAINYQISGPELRVQFLRIADPILDAAKRGKRTTISPFALP